MILTALDWDSILPDTGSAIVHSSLVGYLNAHDNLARAEFDSHCTLADNAGESATSDFRNLAFGREALPTKTSESIPRKEYSSLTLAIESHLTASAFWEQTWKELANHLINTECVKETYKLCEEGNKLAAMECLYTRVHRLLYAKEYSVCDELIQIFDNKECPEIVGVGLLRASFAARQHLNSWEGLLVNMKERLGEDSRLLRGLA